MRRSLRYRPASRRSDSLGRWTKTEELDYSARLLRLRVLSRKG